LEQQQSRLRLAFGGRFEGCLCVHGRQFVVVPKFGTKRSWVPQSTRPSSQVACAPMRLYLVVMQRDHRNVAPASQSSHAGTSRRDRGDGVGRCATTTRRDRSGSKACRVSADHVRPTGLQPAPAARPCGMRRVHQRRAVRAGRRRSSPARESSPRPWFRPVARSQWPHRSCG